LFSQQSRGVNRAIVSLGVGQVFDLAVLNVRRAPGSSQRPDLLKPAWCHLFQRSSAL